MGRAYSRREPRQDGYTPVAVIIQRQFAVGGVQHEVRIAERHIDLAGVTRSETVEIARQNAAITSRRLSILILCSITAGSAEGSHPKPVRDNDRGGRGIGVVAVREEAAQFRLQLKRGKEITAYTALWRNGWPTRVAYAY